MVRTRVIRIGRPPKQRTEITSHPNVWLAIPELIAARQREVGRPISRGDVIAESGVSKHVVHRAALGRLKEVKLEDIGRLASYFGVSIGELFAIDGEVVVGEQDE